MLLHSSNCPPPTDAPSPSASSSEDATSTLKADGVSPSSTTSRSDASKTKPYSKVLAGMSEYYGSEGFDRPPPDVHSSFGGFVFDEGGYFEGGYEGGSFGDDGARA